MEMTVFRDADIQAPVAPTIDLSQVTQGLKNVRCGVSPGSFTADMDNPTYHSQRAFISRSGMSALLRSPAHLFEAMSNRDDEGAPNIGTAVHAAVLEPAEFAANYIAYTGGRRQGKAWEEFQAANAGKVILNAKELAEVEGMNKAVRHFEDFPLSAAIDAGEKEMSIFWTDPATGVGCRIRVDCLTLPVIFDLKSIDDAREDKVRRFITSMDYDLQAFMYTEGVRAFTGQTCPFVFIFVETSRPHGVWLHTAGQSILRNGRIKFERGVRAFKQLQETGDWHGYRNAMSVLELSRWQMLDEEIEV